MRVHWRVLTGSEDNWLLQVQVLCAGFVNRWAAASQQLAGRSSAAVEMTAWRLTNDRTSLQS
jgi:hypothetical protein